MSTATPAAPAFPTLGTERLCLREITHADTETLFAIHGDDELMKWFGEPAADRDAMRQTIDLFASWRTLPDPGFRWGLERRSDQTLIGTCGLMGWRPRDRRCTVGYDSPRRPKVRDS